MLMNGEYLENLEDLKRCFSIDELIYSYYNGELEIWLGRIGEGDRAEKVYHLTKQNAFLLVRLYEVLDLQPEDTEEKIRQNHASVQ